MADITKLESELWEAADELRANSKLSSQEYCMPVLGLIFLRYAWGRFKRVDEQIDAERAKIEGRKPPKSPADYTAKGAMYLPEEARYNYLVNLPDNEDIGKAVNDAMAAIAKDNPNLQGVLPDTYTELGNDILREVLRIFNNKALDEDGDDIIGRIYEYFLNKFAPLVASDDGVFFTPKSLVRMIMNILEPAKGTMLDPACGSGGMFVSASDYVREHGGNPADTMMYFGQEKVDYNAKLCLMNMAVHGMQGVIKSGDEANSFYHDAHELEGKCDFVAANPPVQRGQGEVVSRHRCRTPAARHAEGEQEGRGLHERRELPVDQLLLLVFERRRSRRFRHGVLRHRFQRREATEAKARGVGRRRRDALCWQQLLLHEEPSLHTLVLRQGKALRAARQGALHRRAALPYRRQHHVERMDALATEEPLRHRVALSRRAGQVHRSVG